MELSTTDLALARETTAEILEELELDGYLFEIEPGQDGWALRVECGAEGGWGTITMPIAADDLIASRQDRACREALVKDLRQRLADCKIRE